MKCMCLIASCQTEAQQEFSFSFWGKKYETFACYKSLKYVRDNSHNDVLHEIPKVTIYFVLNLFLMNGLQNDKCIWNENFIRMGRKKFSVLFCFCPFYNSILDIK